MASHSVLTAIRTHADWVPGHVGPSSQLMLRHGGKYLSRTADHEVLEAVYEDTALRIIIQWPSTGTAKTFMNVPDNLSIFAARTAGPESHHFLIEAEDGLA